MGKEVKAYRRLQKQLNRQAVGFPATITGADIRLLKTMFSPDEAAVASHLQYRFVSEKDICRKVSEKENFSHEEIKIHLENMQKKGAINFRLRNDERQFCSMPLIVGMYEGQVNRLTPEFRDAFSRYTGSLPYGISWLKPETSQMRTIPIRESIKTETPIAPATDVDALLKANKGPFVILECICRKKKSLEGETCRVTERDETCLAMGDLAVACMEMNTGREIDYREAADLIALSQKEGLVLQPSNSAEPEFICSCCGCCCGMLSVQKSLPRPVDFWATAFHAAVDESACIGCRRCVKSCQVDAIIFHKKTKKISIDSKRCIGCGNCIAPCPEGALSLRKNSDPVPIPDTMEVLYDMIMERKKGMWETFMVVVKFLLRVKQ